MRLRAFVSGTLMALALGAEAAGAEFKEVHKTIPLDPSGRVTIDTYKGWITVTTWDQPQVDVSARIEPDNSGSNQAEKIDETEVRIEGSGSRVRIKSDYDGIRRRGFLGIFGDDETLPFVRYTLKLPPTAHLEITDYKSESHIAGLKAGLDLNTYKGRVEIADMEGSVRLETYKGDVHAEFARLESSEFETYKGEIEIALPHAAPFDLDANIGRHGSLHSEVEVLTKTFGGEDDGERHRGSANGGGPELRLETYKGNFRIRAR